MKAEVTCRHARNFPVDDMLIRVKVVVRFSQGLSAVQCREVERRGECSE
jgi:hypothetical protein